MKPEAGPTAVALSAGEAGCRWWTLTHPHQRPPPLGARPALISREPQPYRMRSSVAALILITHWVFIIEIKQRLCNKLEPLKNLKWIKTFDKCFLINTDINIFSSFHHQMISPMASLRRGHCVTIFQYASYSVFKSFKCVQD